MTTPLERDELVRLLRSYAGDSSHALVLRAASRIEADARQLSAAVELMQEAIADQVDHPLLRERMRAFVAQEG